MRFPWSQQDGEAGYFHFENQHNDAGWPDSVDCDDGVPCICIDGTPEAAAFLAQQKKEEGTR